MATEPKYEVLTLKKGEWQIESHYSDKEEAIEVASRLHSESHLDGVKVIVEQYDSDSGKSKEQVILDSTIQKDVKPTQSTSSESRVAPRRPANKTSQGRKKKSSASDMGVALKACLWLGLILVGGLLILYGVDYASAFLNKVFK